MPDHDYLEQLCSLAAAGDVTSEEFAQVQEHLHACASCRAAYRDYHSLLQQGLPALAPPPSRGCRDRWRQRGLKKRFLKRAEQEGIAIEHPARRSEWRWAPLGAGALALAAFAGYSLRWERIVERPAPTAIVRDTAQEMKAFSDRIAELERQLAGRLPAATSSPPEPVANVSRERELTLELNRVRDEYAAAIEARKRLDETVAALSRQLDQFRGESQSARGEAEALRRSLAETQASLADANRNLAPLRLARAADSVTIAEQRARLEDLSGRIREQTETVQRERELLAAGKDIRDLMGARDLHVIDVVDDGAPGKKRAIPGRVFYTQGKSLIFYAFDLENRGNPRNVAFQVWGKREGRSQQARNLGIFFQDDARQKRWMMKFEDAAVLAEIDQVFVTVERPGGSRQPTGRQLLFAAIPREANHP